MIAVKESFYPPTSCLLWPPRLRLSSRRPPEPFPWLGLHRPSAVSDRPQQLEASSPVCSSPCFPLLSGKGSPRSIQGQHKQFLKTLGRESLSSSAYPAPSPPQAPVF